MMWQNLDFYKRSKPTKKEKLIEAEINFYGYNVVYINKTMEYDNEMERLVAFTVREHINDNDVGRLVVMVAPEIEKVGGRFWINRYIIHVLIHELAHVILLEDKTYSLLSDGITDSSYIFHGIRFSEVYTDLCKKYRIRDPDRRFYLD